MDEEQPPTKQSLTTLGEKETQVVSQPTTPSALGEGAKQARSGVGVAGGVGGPWGGQEGAQQVCVHPKKVGGGFGAAQGVAQISPMFATVQ
jgi:hypothetical protein